MEQILVHFYHKLSGNIRNKNVGDFHQKHKLQGKSWKLALLSKIHSSDWKMKEVEWKNKMWAGIYMYINIFVLYVIMYICWHRQREENGLLVIFIISEHCLLHTWLQLQSLLVVPTSTSKKRSQIAAMAIPTAGTNNTNHCPFYTNFCLQVVPGHVSPQHQLTNAKVKPCKTMD